MKNAYNLILNIVVIIISLSFLALILHGLLYFTASFPSSSPYCPCSSIKPKTVTCVLIH